MADNGLVPSDQVEVRRAKISRMRTVGIIPFAERFDRTHSLSEARSLADGQRDIRIAGRVIALRHFGKLIFGHLLDFSGKMQFALQKGDLGASFDQFKEYVDIGDFVGLVGQIMTTKTGEKTLSIVHWSMLAKALRPLPEKFHGVSDPEIRLRQRYLDLICTPQTMERFKLRSMAIAVIRRFLEEYGFVEIDTPVLTNTASGAMARPFVTHYHALDIDVYLRIAPETYLKRAVAGGFERVYEFARSFRNEGIDSSHLPDFTMLEYYVAYWNYEDNMLFTEKLIKHLVQEVKGSLSIEYGDRVINFGGEWPRICFRDLILRDCGVDINACLTREDLLSEIERRGIAFGDDVDVSKASRGTLMDLLYKKVSRPLIIDPVFVIKHPVDLSPLARRNDADPTVVDRFQLVVNGWEVVNAYSELIDPIDQAARFVQQQMAKARGDANAMEAEYDFLRCMEYGMPPMSGWGMGVDRMVALLTNAQSLRDVVLFPLLRPEKD